ncbi:MAG: hypothetical protein L3J01_04775 [Thiomicrorhabdus sp.]|nr:hypothetical protein [Thiomicrorhabdus sp.]
MVKTIKLHFFYCVICILLLLGGCKNTEHVFLENNTNEIIIVQVYLLTENGEKIMKTSIDPGDSDGWSYEVGIFGSDKIDEKFKKIIINNKECEVELSRNEINNLVDKSGAWKLVIDKNIMNCN